MQRKRKFLVLLFCFALVGIAFRVKISRVIQAKNEEAIYEEGKDDIEPVVFMHFFDWFKEASWVEEEFVDKLLWKEIGITDNDRESEEFYYKQFSYIKSLGVDAISWEYSPRKGMAPSYPSQNALKALERAELKIAPFFDYEIAIKVDYSQEPTAILSQSGAICPNEESAYYIIGYLREFYTHVPKDLWAVDGKGRTVIYVFGYDFNDDSIVAEWEQFAGILVSKTREMVSNDLAFYWTYKNSAFAEHLFLKHRDNFIPFQFVLDTPQAQFGHDSVTWNLGFDNLGVQIRDGLKRVIRLDKRYVREMGWLSGATNPAAIFIYGWNEPFEGSIVMPTEQWGDTKAQLVRSFIERLDSKIDKSLKSVLLIVDDLDQYYLQEEEDWHYVIEREMLLYPMRRFLPQADVCTTDEISDRLLDQYSCIVDISVDKRSDQRELLKERMDEQQIMVYDPKGIYEDKNLIDYFVEADSALSINGDAQILGSLVRRSSNIFARDDILNIKKLNNGSKKRLEVFYHGDRNPIVITNNNDIFVNAYNSEEQVLKSAFEYFYGIPMNQSILYGEGLASQRLEVEDLQSEPYENTLERYSVNQYWEIPEGEVTWNKMPLYIDDKYKDFIFGI